MHADDPIGGLVQRPAPPVTGLHARFRDVVAERTQDDITSRGAEPFVRPTGLPRAHQKDPESGQQQHPRRHEQPDGSVVSLRVHRLLVRPNQTTRMHRPSIRSLRRPRELLHSSRAEIRRVGATGFPRGDGRSSSLGSAPRISSLRVGPRRRPRIVAVATAVSRVAAARGLPTELNDEGDRLPALRRRLTVDLFPAALHVDAVRVSGRDRLDRGVPEPRPQIFRAWRTDSPNSPWQIAPVAPDLISTNLEDQRLPKSQSHD